MSGVRVSASCPLWLSPEDTYFLSISGNDLPHMVHKAIAHPKAFLDFTKNVERIKNVTPYFLVVSSVTTLLVKGH